MERIDHIDVVEVGGGCLVGNVDRMLERQVPYREGLELGVTGLDAPLVLLVELAQAYCHFAAARTRRRDDYQRLCRLYVIVAPEPLFRVDEGYVVGVSLDGVVVVGLDAQVLQLQTVCVSTALTVVVGDDHGIHGEPAFLEFVPEAQYIHIVGYAQVLTHLVLLYVQGADHNHDFRPVAELLEHLELAVGLETREYAARVVVVPEFSSKLEVELVAELLHSLHNVLGLYPEVFVVVES